VCLATGTRAQLRGGVNEFELLFDVAYLNRGRFGYRGQGPADGKRLTAQFVRAGLAVVISYRASFFDCGCIDDLLRRLTSQEERLWGSQSYLWKENLGVAVKDWLTASQVAAPSGWVPGLIVVVTCRKHGAAYEGTKAQHLEKGDVAYSHIGDSLIYRRTVCRGNLVNVGEKTLMKGKGLRRRNR
jgi:hypothetical protein